MNIGAEASIGELAKITSTKVVTIRYYERIGLLPSPPRTSGNYRVYDRGQMSRLRSSADAATLDSRLTRSVTCPGYRPAKEQDCAEVDQLAAAHLAGVQAKIADLKRLEGELQRLNSSCQGGGRIADCRIIEVLSPQTRPHGDKVGWDP